MTHETIVSGMQMIETDRLRLRLPQPKDREGVWSAAHHEADITKGMMWDPPETMDEIDQWTLNALDGWKRGDSLTWTIEQKATQEFIGRIVMRKQQEKGNVWYIGFWIHPHHQRKGYVTEAVAAVIDAGFTRIHMNAIVSSHADWNTGSAKALLKIGMRHTGHNPAGFQKHGKDVPEEEYELTYDEWVGRKEYSGEKFSDLS